MGKRILITMLLALLLVVGPLMAADDAVEDAVDKAVEKAVEKDEEKSLEPAEQIALIKAVSPSLVRVEFTAKFDKGKAAPGCERAIREERAVERTGYLLSPTLVITDDITVHPRFIKRLFVTYKSEQVDAVVKAYSKDTHAILLELAKPLTEAKPLVFDAKAEEPYYAINYGRYGSTLTKRVWSLKLPSVYTTERNRQYRAGPSGCLIVEKTGKPVAISFASRWPVDDSWKGSPLKWPMLPAKDMKKSLANVQKNAEQGLMRVTLNFRSPKKRSDMGRYGGDESKTEINTTGALIDKNSVLVLTNMLPKVTARLERITVHPQKGEPISAKFKCTMKDYGGFVVTLEKPLTGPVKLLKKKDIRDYRNQLLLSAEIIIQGKKRVAYYKHYRINSFDMGWKRHIYPQAGWGSGGDFFFDLNGTLLALPIARREKVSVKRWGGSGATLTSTSYLTEVLGDLKNKKNIDVTNVPLTEEEENRLAWLGVELQGLNTELARINNVSDLTNDGSTGAMVSYVYPGSPADRAGIKAGVVMLRIHGEDQPKPIEVRVDSYAFAGRGFRWEWLDRISEQDYDRIPRPWPSRENTVTRALTDLGFGKKYQVEFFIDEKIVKKDFKVVVSPPHYDTAKRYKSKVLGLTVRNLTYELQRYFQKKPGEAGVIVSKIEPGSKVSVRGLKPYEIITHVNGKEVANVKEFERLIKGQAELQLLVKRMTRGRTIKITLSQPTTKPAETTRPAETEKTEATKKPLEK